MRPDFIGDCGHHTGLTEIVNKSLVLIPPLSLEERLVAVTEPLKVDGGAIEADFAKWFVTNAAGLYPDDLVVMQHILSRMWARVGGSASHQGNHAKTTDKRLLTRALFEAVGGFDSAVDLNAEEILSTLSYDEQRLASIIFKSLTEENSGRLFSRPLQLNDIAELASTTIDQLQGVIQPFHQAGLLSKPENTSEWAPDTPVEISHGVGRHDKLTPWRHEN